MLRGIKERAEGHPLVPVRMMLAARIGWMLTAGSLLLLFVARRHCRPWVLLPIVIALPVLRSTGDWNAALATFLAIGVTLLGALAFGRRWWPPYLLLAAALALILVLAPDAYAALGVTFGVVCVAMLTRYLSWTNT